MGSDLSAEKIFNDGGLSSEVQHLEEEGLIRSEPAKAFTRSEIEQSVEGIELLPAKFLHLLTVP